MTAGQPTADPPTGPGGAPGPRRRTIHRRRWIVLLLGLLGVVVLGGWRYRVTRPDYRLDRGEEALRVKDWDEVTYLVERLDAAGHHDHANLLRGEALQARGRPDLALLVLNKIRDEGELRLRAVAVSGRCLLELGELREAHRAFSFVVGERPDHVDAHRGLAAVAYDLGQLGLAVAHLVRVAELDPQDARPHRLIGLINKDMGQYDKAAPPYREALRRGLPAKEEGEVRIELAEVLVRTGEFAEAVGVLDAGEPDGRGTARWAAARSEALRGAGRAREAAELLDRETLRHAGADDEAALHRTRGQLYLDGGDPAAAAKSLERAVELDRADYRSSHLLATAYAAAGRKDDAAREFARADGLKKDYDEITELTRAAMDRPWDSGIRLRLAGLFEKLGKPRLAGMWRKAAAACSAPSGP